jgi:hypothetical protein
MTHLTSDELIDAIDHALEPSRQAHLDGCQPCRRQVAELDAVLGQTHAVDVPEPSPLYWQHLSARVRTAIDAEPMAVDGWPGWLRWPVLAPIAALALIVMALAVALPRQATVDRDVAVASPSDVGLDDRFAIVADLVGDIDWDTAVSAGLTVALGTADQAVLELSAAEQEELTRLLQAELTRAKS